MPAKEINNRFVITFRAYKVLNRHTMPKGKSRIRRLSLKKLTKKTQYRFNE